jgi:hypothetical protein
MNQKNAPSQEIITIQAQMSVIFDRLKSIKDRLERLERVTDEFLKHKQDFQAHQEPIRRDINDIF